MKKTLTVTKILFNPKHIYHPCFSSKKFTFYPDVYAILFNEVHLFLSPVTHIEDLKKYYLLFEKILKDISPHLYTAVANISNTFLAELAMLSGGNNLLLFQGNIPADYRMECNIINFLMQAE
ncbi:MAG: hypothetical protein IPM72_10695 [Chitinophagaceae bacterium]|nr:hypothetical protein [Chitinophagaceae bacterium]